MSKSKAKAQRNNFVRGVRAETSLNAYTRALGYVQTRPISQVAKLLEERIAFYRAELQSVQLIRGARQRAESSNPTD